MDTRSVKGQREPVLPSPFGNDRVGGDLFCIKSRTDVVDVCDLAQSRDRAVSASFPVRGHFLGDVQDPTDDWQKIRFRQRVLDEGCAPPLQGAEFGEGRFRDDGVWGHGHLERIAKNFQRVNTGCDSTHALEVFQPLHPDRDVKRKHDADDGGDHLNPCSPSCLIHFPELPFWSPKMIAGGRAAGKLGRCCP